MSEFDMTPAISISVQPLKAVRESFVEFRYFLPSYVALVSPFINELIHLIDRLRGTDGSEVDIEIAVREADIECCHPRQSTRIPPSTLCQTSLWLGRRRLDHNSG